MYILLGNTNINIFAKTLRYLAKYDSELLIQAQPDIVIFKALSNTKTSIAIVTFEKSFFVRYEIDDNPDENVIRVAFNAILPVFKKYRMFAECRIKFKPDDDFLNIRVKKSNEIIYFHKINLLEAETVDEVPSIRDVSELTCSPISLGALHLKTIREMKVTFSNDEVFMENVINNCDDDYQKARIHYKIEVADFERYDLKQETTLIFVWNDFYRILELAMILKLDIQLRFQRTGKPLYVKIETGANYTVESIQMTMKEQTIQRRIAVSRDSAVERTRNYYKDKGLSVSDSELASIIDKNIVTQSEREPLTPTMSNNANKSNRSEIPSTEREPLTRVENTSKRPNISDHDMDGMIAAVSREQAKRPRIEQNEVYAALSQQDKNEVDAALQSMVFDFDELDEIEFGDKKNNYDPHEKKISESTVIDDGKFESMNYSRANETEKSQNLIQYFSTKPSKLKGSDHWICSGSDSEEDKM